jgi:hypothetical protein
MDQHASRTFSIDSRPLSSKLKPYNPKPSQNIVQRNQRNKKIKEIAFKNINDRRAEVQHSLINSQIGQA